MNTTDLDAFRDAYPHLSYAEHQALYSRIWASHPEQRHFDIEECARAIERVRPQNVIEIGGWDGELAHMTLSMFAEIAAWMNVEVCREARDAGRGRHPRYHAVDYDGWHWDGVGNWPADLLVASHTIEHLSAEHLGLMLDTARASRVRALWFDAPLLDAPLDWHGSPTTHILEIGWDGVTAMCAERGWSLTWAHDHATALESGGYSRACLYERAA